MASLRWALCLGECGKGSVETARWKEEFVINAISFLFSAAGCTFEEDSDPTLCDFTQGEEDDFDWLLFRTYASPYASSDLLRGEWCCSRACDQPGLQKQLPLDLSGIWLCDLSERCWNVQISFDRCLVSIFNEAFSPFLSALCSPWGSFYVNQPHRANGNQHFPAILFSTGCQREMACIVYKALLLFCINKHLRGADKDRSAASAQRWRNISGARRLEELEVSEEASPLPCGSRGNESITMKTRVLSLVRKDPESESTAELWMWRIEAKGSQEQLKQRRQQRRESFEKKLSPAFGDFSILL